MSTSTAPLRLPRVLYPDNTDVARALLSHYLTTFTGRGFESVGHPWNDPAHANKVTTADIVALSCLAVPVGGDAVMRLLVEDAGRVSALLADAPPPETNLWEVDEKAILDPEEALQSLWQLLRDIPGMGPTSASKLMARKRPRLVPIYDSVVAQALGMRSARGHWEMMHTLLLSEIDGETVHEHLSRLSEGVAGAELVTPLRAFDIVTWYAHSSAPGQVKRRQEAFEQAGLDDPVAAERAITAG
ncbi:DUF6308 family protein [Sanguibacter sp. HDW7]|uniref:DUF6308 family protein n=1 Tax=Sanguibacter sp. HDW7 TaxID=2714931 RepID=UPI0014076FAD|nr:DUF6308 family protein [Sanguibacter sp. HDW7]QIK83168.1 hypothetical protein G7063_05635 [Sanguibacter sp. HDW7]